MVASVALRQTLPAQLAAHCASSPHASPFFRFETHVLLPWSQLACAAHAPGLSAHAAPGPDLATQAPPRHTPVAAHGAPLPQGYSQRSAPLADPPLGVAGEPGALVTAALRARRRRAADRGAVVVVAVGGAGLALLGAPVRLAAAGRRTAGGARGGRRARALGVHGAGLSDRLASAKISSHAFRSRNPSGRSRLTHEAAYASTFARQAAAAAPSRRPAGRPQVSARAEVPSHQILARGLVDLPELARAQQPATLAHTLRANASTNLPSGVAAVAACGAGSVQAASATAPVATATTTRKQRRSMGVDTRPARDEIGCHSDRASHGHERGRLARCSQPRGAFGDDGEGAVRNLKRSASRTRRRAAPRARRRSARPRPGRGSRRRPGSRGCARATPRASRGRRRRS